MLSPFLVLRSILTLRFISGPKRYDYSEEVDSWIYSRDSRAMGDLLNDELGRILEQDVDLRLAKISESVL